MQPINGNRAARRQWYALRADWFALVRQSGDAKEYVGVVGGAHFRSFVRMRRHPFANALHRHLLARNKIALNEHAADRGIGITVVRIVVDAQRGAVLEDYARGAFNLDREDVEWILEPANFKFLPVERAGLNSAAVVVRHDLVVLVATTDPRTFVWKCIGAWPVAGRDQIRRAAVERDMEFGIGKARALNNRLEITGKKSLAFAQTRYAHRLKILLEEGASSVRVLRLQVCGFAADIPQRAMDRSVAVGGRNFAQSLAACLIRCECRQVIIGPPTRELGPIDRLELAVPEFQRFFGRCGGGCET